MIKYYTGCRNGNRYTGFWLADIVSFIELHTAVTILMLALKSFCSMSKLALTPNYRGLSPQVTTWYTPQISLNSFCGQWGEKLFMLVGSGNSVDQGC